MSQSRPISKSSQFSTRQQRRRWAAMVAKRNAKLDKFNDDARWFPGGPKSARLAVFRPENALAMLEAAAAGGERGMEATWIIRAAARYGAECDRYEPGQGFQCLCCDDYLGVGNPCDAVVLLAPVKSDETTVATGVCRRCASARSDEALAQEYADYFQKVWPGAYVGGRL
ncbi:hypothetical protein [Rhizobium sp. RAF56]|uniref:hypothetical protein n=1 Tax=Rhizobium sp. RAF56 TaxID=3233062 RepID=UPI003F9C51CA